MEALYDSASELVQSLSREEAITSVLIGADIDVSVPSGIKKSPLVQDFLDKEVGSATDTRFKQVYAAAIALAKQNNCLTFDLPQDNPEVMAVLVDEGLTRVKAAYQLATGAIDPIEVADVMIDKAAARMVAVVDNAFESGLVNRTLTDSVVALMTYLHVPDAVAYREIISSVVARMEPNMQKIAKSGIQFVTTTAKQTVRRFVSGLKSVAQKIKNKLFA